MSDKLREAAQEIRGFSVHCAAHPEKLSKNMLAMFEKVYWVSQAYLAEHPADDDEPVTEEWLLSVGFVHDATHVVLRNWGPQRNGNIQAYPNGKWWLNGTAMIQMKTRGQVRRLCAALGIGLKEAANP